MGFSLEPALWLALYTVHRYGIGEWALCRVCSRKGQESRLVRGIALQSFGGSGYIEAVEHSLSDRCL